MKRSKEEEKRQAILRKKENDERIKRGEKPIVDEPKKEELTPEQRKMKEWLQKEVNADTDTKQDDKTQPKKKDKDEEKMKEWLSKEVDQKG